MRSEKTIKASMESATRSIRELEELKATLQIEDKIKMERQIADLQGWAKALIWVLGND